ncbi:hypothetical protein [Horticoccus sp. 23ND18S-11]|uniref:hypothetical protein n=1 Tax=Horticoccus sp. 23ND18S-11 TaxID=3391832 RepID=UPI0039C9386B
MKGIDQRITYIDYTKGVLVVLMVVYHSLNYTTQYELAFRYLSFLPLSFIFIAGLLISRIYLPRYQSGTKKLTLRLLGRGLRLVALFTVLNIAVQYVRSPNYGSPSGVGAFFRGWVDVYFIGGSRLAAFDILLPIAYVIMASPVLLWLIRASQSGFIIGALSFVVGCCFMEVNGHGVANLSSFSVGLLGVALGALEFNSLLIPVRLIGAVYLVYYPIGIIWGWIFLVQLFGAVLSLFLLFAISARLDQTSFWSRRMICLGQYSLVGYIVQIGYLQLFSRLLGRPEPWSANFFLIFMSTLIGTVLITGLLALMRSRMAIIDRAYKVVFA